jgi:predicted lipoprotein with Yx(FWY)xxD motif
MPNRLTRDGGRSPRRPVVILLGAVGGVAMLALAGLAVAKSFTLTVEKNAHVDNAAAAKFAVKPVNTHEAVAVGPSGYPVYTFQGETTHHIICKKTTSATTNCWAFWPPVSPSSSGAVTKPSGIHGKLATFRNHGTTQLTLNGQPLYYFTPDIMSHNKHQALGDELKTFGSIWHVVKASEIGGAVSQTGTQGSPSPSPYPNGY